MSLFFACLTGWLTNYAMRGATGTERSNKSVWASLAAIMTFVSWIVETQI